jgi:hypothetical protein
MQNVRSIDHSGYEDLQVRCEGLRSNCKAVNFFDFVDWRLALKCNVGFVDVVVALVPELIHLVAEK